MEIADLITPRSVIPQLRATNKKQALLELAKRAAAMTGIHERTIFDVLIERERLGTTGIGMGVAIPHGRFPELDKPCGIFARLDNGLLHIDLVRPEVESRVRTIAITDGPEHSPSDALAGTQEHAAGRMR